MSRKNHVIVGRSFTLSDVENPSFGKERFHHITGRQARALAQAGAIRQIGESGHIWQYTSETSETACATETGRGLVARDVASSLRQVLRAALLCRPLRDPSQS